MKLQLLKRTVAFLLVVIVSFVLIMDTYAKQDSTSQFFSMVTEKETSEREPSVVRELKELRTKNSTTYLLSDGSRKLEMNSTNIRFDKNGDFVDYNPNLKEMVEKDSSSLRKVAKATNILPEKDILDYAYVNSAGDAKHYFPKALDENTGIFMKKDQYAIQFLPIIYKSQNIRSYQESKNISLEIQENSVRENEIVYQDKDENIKYKYSSYSSHVKEEIILKNKPETNVFEFIFNLSGMKLETVGPDKRIQMIDKNSNIAVAYIDSPNIKEKNGEIRYDVIDYEIELQDNGTYLLKVVVDEEYLQSTDLMYPVTIDPTVVWMDSYLESATVSNYVGHTSLNLKNGASFEVQNCGRKMVPFNDTEYRCYIDTKGRPLSGNLEEVYGSYIKSAGLRLVEYNDLPNNVGTIEVRTPEGTWSPNTITWHNAPQMGSKVWAQFQTKGKKGTAHNVDLTEWAQAVASGQINNYGLILKAKEKGTRAYFYGSSLQNIRYMQVSIVYWPYIAEVNHSYDNGYNVRYSQPQYGSTPPAQMIAGHQEWVSSVFGQLFGLKITSGTPQLYTSLADECKIKRGLTINTDTIEEKCPGGEGHNNIPTGAVGTGEPIISTCTHMYGAHYSFCMEKPSTLTPIQRCEVLWSGHTYNDKDNNNYNQNWYWRNSIIITWKREAATRYEEEKRSLLHELGHCFGAPDEYCKNSNIPSDEDCGNQGCPTHHPERNAGVCIMGGYYGNGVTNQEINTLFCKYCKSDEPFGIPYHLERYNKIK